MKCNVLAPGLVALLVTLPSAALANQACKLESTEHFTLDEVASVTALNVAIGANSLRLEGDNQAHGELIIRKCASSDERLGALQVSLQQQGEELTVELDHGGKSNRFSFLPWGQRNNYGYFNRA